MTTKKLLILFIFTGFFTLDEISNKAQANQAPEDIYNLTGQDIQNTRTQSNGY